jgi:hypothetical protein
METKIRPIQQMHTEKGVEFSVRWPKSVSESPANAASNLQFATAVKRVAAGS